MKPAIRFTQSFDARLVASAEAVDGRIVDIQFAVAQHVDAEPIDVVQRMIKECDEIRSIGECIVLAGEQCP